MTFTTPPSSSSMEAESPVVIDSTTTTTTPIIIDDSNISRDCIQCDATGCGTKDPWSRCSNCRSVFYCGVDCQKRHWKQHKRSCLKIEDGIQKMIQDDGFFGGMLHYSNDDVELAVQEQNKATDSDSGTSTTTVSSSCCSICLQEPIPSPVLVKACRHTFCSPCLYKWQIQSQNNSPNNAVVLPFSGGATPRKIFLGKNPPTECPTCRGPAGPGQVVHTLVAIAQQALAKAQQRAATSTAAAAAVGESKEANDDDHLLQTLQEIDKVLAVQKQKQGDADFALYATKAQILLFLEKPKDALECLSDFDAVHQDPAWKGETQEGLGMLLLESQALMQMKNWRTALDRCTIKSAVSLAFSQLRLVHMMQAQCEYNLGKYDAAIRAIDSVMGMTVGKYRHYPGIRKYKALALQAKGNVKEALLVMNQAVLYETPYEGRAIGETAGGETALDIYMKMLAQTKN